jgi:hypothetical protein
MQATSAPLRLESTATHPARSSTCSNYLMAVRRPEWWFYPEQCEHGHEWGPGRMLVSWARCYCAPARSAHPDEAAWGHLTVTCQEPGCGSVWYSPPHDQL